MPERDPARDDLALLAEAARAAGVIARRFWRNNPEVHDKPGDAGPVSEADLAVNRMLEAELRAARPDYGWLSEESDDSEERLTREHLFIVDPIDGTRTFLAGHESFAHSLAVARAGVVMAAAVYLPIPDLLFTAGATSAAPARLNGAAIRATVRAGIAGAHVLAAGHSLKPDRWPGGLPDLRHSFRSSLAYRLCLVAEGRFDGMITLRDSWEWDIAAGTLIAARAGATVSDRHGAALRFNNASPQTPGVIAAAPGLHADLMDRLAPG